MDRGIVTCVEAVQAVSLDELNRSAQLLTRQDNKYYLPRHLFARFVAALGDGWAALEISGRRDFGYDSLYFDTPSLLTYRMHAQGRRRRFKARTRLYLDSGDCFFEAKLKGGRGETIKRKMPYDPEDRRRLTPEALGFLEDVLWERYAMLPPWDLRPTLSTVYRRITLVSRELSERMTCDFDLAFTRPDGARSRMLEEFVLLETKSALGRGAADRVLWSLGARPAVSSKYCLGIKLLEEAPGGNRLHRTIRSFYGGPERVPHMARHGAQSGSSPGADRPPPAPSC